MLRVCRQILFNHYAEDEKISQDLFTTLLKARAS